MMDGHVAFCQSKLALDSVAAGISERAGVLKSAVGVECEAPTGRRMLEVAPRRMMDNTGVKYTLQVPAGSDAKAVAAALSTAPQDLKSKINNHLSQGTAFTIEVQSMAASAFPQPIPQGSMPADLNAALAAGNGGLEAWDTRVTEKSSSSGVWGRMVTWGLVGVTGLAMVLFLPRVMRQQEVSTPGAGQV